MSICELTYELTSSLRKPTRKTLSLINRALSYLTPFESAGARTASAAERQDLLQLLKAHRLVLAPYLDTDRIEAHLRRPFCQEHSSTDRRVKLYDHSSNSTPTPPLLREK